MVDGADFKELVRSRTDLVTLIGESVALSPRRGGGEFVGLCPFHDDHNPSMCVYPDRQSFRCWVCDTGGDAFSFVMKHENLSFIEALDLLAERAGLERPQRSSEGGTSGKIDKPRLYDLLAWAARQYRVQLSSGKNSQEARDYLAGRGISAEMLERFGLGHVPRDWQWLQSRARGTYTPRELQVAGLTKPKRDGDGAVDFFVDRVIFPIRDERGRTVHFGGRILPGPDGQPRDEKAGPKYLNGGDTPLFLKSNLVFGLDLARDAIKTSKTAVVMEGYTDVIAAHQHGVTNVVATLGTALAESHVRLLRRFAETVVLVFDGDAAGIQAAERALLRFLTQDVDLRILTLPGGLDPADYLANDGAHAFSDLLRNAPPALEFKLGSAISRFGLDTEYGQNRVVQELLTVVAAAPRLSGTPRENSILRKIADRLGLREQILRNELKRLRETTPASPRPPAIPRNQNPNSNTFSKSSYFSGSFTNPIARSEPLPPDDRAERELLCCLLVRPDLYDSMCCRIGPDDFTTPRLRAAFEHCRDIADLHGTPAYDLLMSGSEEPNLKQLLVGLDAEARRKGFAAALGAPSATHSLSMGTVAHLGTDVETGKAAHPGSDAEALPRLARDLVEAVVRRRNGRRLELSRGALARQLPAGAPLDDAAKDRLRRYQQQLSARHVPDPLR